MASAPKARAEAALKEAGYLLIERPALHGRWQLSLLPVQFIEAGVVLVKANVTQVPELVQWRRPRARVNSWVRRILWACGERRRTYEIECY
jgi:hypothetical protein